MNKKIIGIFICILFLLSNLSALSVDRVKVNIPENTIFDFPPKIDDFGGSTRLWNDYPTGYYSVSGDDPDGTSVKYFIDYGDGNIDDSDWYMNFGNYRNEHTYLTNIIKDFIVRFWCIDTNNNSSPKLNLTVHVSPNENVGFVLEMLYGRIRFNGIVQNEYEKWFSVTPLSLKYMLIAWDSESGFYNEIRIVTEDPFLFPEHYFDRCFIGDHFMFAWDFGPLEL